MAKIDRNSVDDAKGVFEKFLPDEFTRSRVVEFLCDAIEYADTLKSNGWNLNLDLNGKFVQFNTGHAYCIQIKNNELLILCDRGTLNPIIKDYKVPVQYRGHIRKERKHSTDIDGVPDCLDKVQNSIGCLLPIQEAAEYVHYFKASNRDFIKEAIKTHFSFQSRNAHSKGAIEYMAGICSKHVCQPMYAVTDLPAMSDFIEDERVEVEKARKLSKAQRRQRLNNANPRPEKRIVSQVAFVRNSDVIAEVLERANGICERCKKPAPFIRDSNNSPYLEVHHILPLAEGGDDTVENAVGLCPNCHRHAHNGKSTY